MFNQICILAPGLLGASLLMAVKKQNLCKKAAVWARREETREQCKSMSWCDEVFSEAADAAKDADLLIICTPVESIAPLLKEIAPKLKEGCIVSDVGSTKSKICKECENIIPDHAHFIGSHPIAGSEKTGLEHATDNLFESKICIVTPSESSDPEASKQLQAFWEGIGMKVVSTSPEGHDEILGEVSHLPHLLASALCNHLDTKNPDWTQFAGTGLKDTTRIAAGSPEMWRDIFIQNKDSVLKALLDFRGTLDNWVGSIEKDDFEKVLELLRTGKEYREKLK